MDYISRTMGLSPAAQIGIFKTVVVILASLLLRALSLKVLLRRTENVRYRFIVRNTVNYGITAIAVLMLADIWFKGFAGLQTYLGLLSAGLAIALRDPLTNLAAWLFILSRKPFTVGDRVEIGDIRGDVIDIRVFQFLLLEVGGRVRAEQSTGRIMYIPNARIFTHPTANYTVGFPYVWNELVVLVTFESDWRAAKDILIRLVQEFSEPIREKAEKSVKDASRAFLIAYNELRPTIYTSVAESGVRLTARYLCQARQIRQSEHFIWERLLDAFKSEPTIDFAYPTLRYYTQETEGTEVGGTELKKSGGATPDGDSR